MGRKFKLLLITIFINESSFLMPLVFQIYQVKIVSCKQKGFVFCKKKREASLRRRHLTLDLFILSDMII